MPNPQIYTDELELFKGKYNLEDYDLYKVQESDKLRNLGNVLNNGNISGSTATQFIGWAKETLSIYLETNTKLNENGKYMSSFNLTEFLTDFEKLADAKYRSELEDDQEPTRKKYAGAKIKALNNALIKPLEETNKTLPTLWKEDIKKGDMDIDKLQEIVNSSYDKIKGAKEVDKSQMKGEATNVVAAYQALKQLRKSREGFIGWFWKLFNSKINEKEEACYLNLQSKVNDLKLNGVDTESLLAELNGKTVLGKEVKEKVKENVKPKTTSTKSKGKPLKIRPIAQRMSEKMEYDQSVFINELIDKVPKNGMADINRQLAYKTLFWGINQGICELNIQFDEAVANGADPKKEMEKVVKGIFKLSVEKFSNKIDCEDLGKAESHKIITQVVTNMFTAASVYPKELGDVANTYIEQTVEQYMQIAREGKDYLHEIKEIENNREKVFDNGNLFAENNANKSEPINQPPQHKVPTIKNK